MIVIIGFQNYVIVCLGYESKMENSIILKSKAAENDIPPTAHHIGHIVDIKIESYVVVAIVS